MEEYLKYIETGLCTLIPIAFLGFLWLNMNRYIKRIERQNRNALKKALKNSNKNKGLPPKDLTGYGH